MILKEQMEQSNKKVSDTLNHVNMEANVEFKELRDKLQESNKKIEDERAYVVDIFKKLESSGHIINNINTELDNEREKGK